MKVIALRGDKNVGKTSILKKLMSKLLTGGGRLVESWHRNEVVYQMIDPNDDKWLKRGDKGEISDLTVTLEYKGSIITITSLGDMEKIIFRELEKAKLRLKKKGTKGEIAVYICACHPGMNIASLPGCDHVSYIDKEKCESADMMNDDKFIDDLVFELDKSI